jgi:hypothetical protein
MHYIDMTQDWCDIERDIAGVLATLDARVVGLVSLGDAPCALDGLYADNEEFPHLDESGVVVVTSREVGGAAAMAAHLVEQLQAAL